jgi:hypothetical protein
MRIIKNPRENNDLRFGHYIFNLERPTSKPIPLKCSTYPNQVHLDQKTSDGNSSSLLSIHSLDDTEQSFNLEDFNNSNKAGIKSSDKPLLGSFIRHLGIEGVENLEDLKLKLNQVLNQNQNSGYTDDESETELTNARNNSRDFISYVRNGAFFKHWADHYAEQAKKMAQILNA